MANACDTNQCSTHRAVPILLLRCYFWLLASVTHLFNILYVIGKNTVFTSLEIRIVLSGIGWDLDDHIAAIRGILGFTGSKSGRI